MDFIVENPEGVSSAELVVGIPSLNEADSIAFPTEMASKGLTEYFPDLKSVIINVDNHSGDGTKEAFFATETAVPKAYISTPKGVRGKGNNFRNLFQAVHELGARGAVVVDADLNTITPAWIRYLAEPVLDSFDFVTPLYVRHKYDGTITNHIAYPLVRSLFGLRVRQPIGGDFGFSGKLACAWLSEPWSEPAGQFGIDIWMTATAIARNFKVCQSFLGTPKGHRPKDPAGDLTPMFLQVVSTLFDLVSRFEFHWKEVQRSQPSSVFGFGLGVGDQVEEIQVEARPLLDSFRAGNGKWGEEVWQRVLSDSTRSRVEELLEVEDAEEFAYHTDLWAHILYDYLVAYKAGSVPRERLIESLVPFYHSRVLSFVNRTRDMGTREAEEYLEEITRTFQREKSYLIQRWNSQASNHLGHRMFV